MRWVVFFVAFSFGFSLTLEEAKLLALKNNLEVIKSEADLKKLEQRIREVRGSLFPTLRFSGRFTKWDPNYISAFVPENKYFLNLNLSQPLFDRTLWAALKVAKKSRELQTLLLKEVKVNVLAEVERAFWTVLLKREILKEKRESMNYWENYFKVVEEKFRSGIVPRFEFLRARAELRQARADLIRAEGEYRTALNSLKILLGITEDVEPEGRFEKVSFKVKDLEKFIERSPHLQVLKKTLQLREEEVEVEKAEYFPKVSFFANYNFENIIDFEEGRLVEATRHGYNLGLKLDFLIFDGFKRSARINQSKLEVLKAKEELSFAKRKLRSDLESLLLQLRSAEEEVKARRDTLSASEESLRFATERYKEGVGTQVELLEARRSYETAKLSYLHAVYNYNLVVVEIKRLLGLYSLAE